MEQQLVTQGFDRLTVTVRYGQVPVIEIYDTGALEAYTAMIVNFLRCSSPFVQITWSKEVTAVDKASCALKLTNLLKRLKLEREEFALEENEGISTVTRVEDLRNLNIPVTPARSVGTYSRRLGHR